MLPTTTVLAALLSLPPQTGAAPAPVWVFFADTRAEPCCADDTVLTELALQRRALRRTLPGLFDRRDTAVAPEAVDAVLSTGAALRNTSRWLNAVSAMATPAQVRALKHLPGVLRVEPVRGGRPGWMNETAAPAQDNSLTFAEYGASEAQLAQIDLLRLHARGFHGAGIVIGILDTGFHRVHDAFFNPAHPLQVIAEYDFVKHDNNTDIQAGDDPDQHHHGTWILGTMAAYLPGTIIGAAYEAKFVLCKTEDVPTETPVEEDNYVAGLEFIEAHGADVATSSLSYIDWYTQADLNGVTAVTTIAVNTACNNGVVCLTAAGNAGHDADPATSTLGAPADGLKILTCGAVNSSGVIASFSSSGPTADGRLKPEILARGVSTKSIDADLTTGLASLSGTSLSTPLLAGAVACILDARPDFTVDSMRSALFATASRSVAGTLHPDPLFVEGHGIVRTLDAAMTGRLPADLNLDGHVDGADLGMLLGQWGAASPNYGDLNNDGSVDGADLGALLGSWG